MDDTIILSRMYAGEYLKNNIGHEIINLFQDDNGNNYIYINKSGKINSKYNDSVKAVLLIRYEEPGVMEVLAKAEGLTQVMYNTGNLDEESAGQVAYVNDNCITYGGVLLHKIVGNSKAEKITITFKADTLRKPKAPLYLIENEAKLAKYDNGFFLPKKNFSNQSLKMYYPQSKLPEDYDVLKSVLSNDDLWEEKNTTEKIVVGVQSGSSAKMGFLSLIKKEYDELVYSNLLAHFFNENRPLFAMFAKEVLGVGSLALNCEIIRESKKDIDLWIEDPDSVLVIENKIKSKINGERHNIYSPKVQSQLSKYYEYAKESCPGKSVHCYVFTPNYNSIDLSKYETGKYYSVIQYSRIYDFYKAHAGEMLHSEYFVEYLDALRLQSKTRDQFNYEEMRDRFISRIEAINNT